jgi:hypothetical protein
MNHPTLETQINTCRKAKRVQPAGQMRFLPFCFLVYCAGAEALDLKND